MANVTLQTFERVFEDDLQLLRNAACMRCDAGMKQPLLPWLVGDRYAQTRERLVFVGKPHRGTPGRVLTSGFIDPTDDVPGMWRGAWPYWRYTREIAERLYGPEAADFVCFTNFVKCTNTEDIDRTTASMVQSCVSEIGVIWTELERLQVRTVVFYTYAFRQVLEAIPFALSGSVKQVTPREHRVTCGQKKLGWWERRFRTSWADEVRVLVVGHPERMNREEYVSRIAAWVRPGVTDGNDAPGRVVGGKWDA